MKLSFDKDMIYATIGIVFGVMLVFVLYSTFFADIDSATDATSIQQVESILPNGDKLNIAPVVEYGSKTNRFNYPKIDTTAIGITNLAELIKPN
jgi:uncharacterized membrane protein YvbJ